MRINEPILGDNVIEHLITEENEKSDLLKSSFVGETSSDKFELMIALIQEKTDTIGQVKIPDKTDISAGSCFSMKCRVKVFMDNNEQTIHFRPGFVKMEMTSCHFQKHYQQ